MKPTKIEVRDKEGKIQLTYWKQHCPRCNKEIRAHNKKSLQINMEIHKCQKHVDTDEDDGGNVDFSGGLDRDEVAQ